MERIVEQGEVKGFLASQFFAEPFPFYYLKFMEVLPQDRGQGKGRQMLAEFTQFLKNHSSCGIVFNSIEGPARGIYQKAGWVDLQTHPGWFAYNLPANLEETKLEEAIMMLQII